MSLPGWYPDPSGEPGQFRYWDGRSWSAQTTSDPRTAAPSAPVAGPAFGSGSTGAGTPGQTGQGTDRPRRRTGLLIGLVALLLVAVLAGVLVVRGLSDDDPTVADPGPSSTQSGWDDSSPLPTATPTPTPTRTPSPTPSSAAPAPLEACPVGDPTLRTTHAADGRYHGGELSFASHSGWEDGSAYLAEMTWAYDVTGEYQYTEPGWLAVFAVGSLKIADGFEAPKVAAEGVMQCMATSDYYSGYKGRTDVNSRAVTVGGKSGWEVRSEVRVDKAGLSVEGDLVSVVVVDTGAGESLSMFVGAVPIGDKSRIATLDSTIAGLKVD